MSKTISEIRRANFDLLLQQAERDVGKARGAVAYLARLCNLTQPALSMIVNSVKTGAGTVRQIGDDMARKLEKGMGLPLGWMDYDHGDAQDMASASIVHHLRGLTAEQRATVATMVEQLATLNAAALRDAPVVPSGPVSRASKH